MYCTEVAPHVKAKRLNCVYTGKSPEFETRYTPDRCLGETANSGSNEAEEHQNTAKRQPRGRPRKPEAPPQPCTEAFDTISGEIVAIAQSKSLWPAAKERVRTKAACDPRLTPTSFKVVTFLLDHVNRKCGYDWHGSVAIAEALGLSKKSVKRAFQQLANAGYIKRAYEIRGGTQASQFWKTTLPALVDAAREIQQERRAKSAEKEGPRKPQRRGPVNSKEGPSYSEEGAQQSPEGGALFGDPITLKRNLGNNPLSQHATSMRSGGVDQINFILQEIASESRERVIRLLIKPLLQQRHFDAPDRAYTLGVIADKAADLSDAVLKDVLKRLLTERSSVVKASDLEAAIRTAQGAAALAQQEEVLVQRGDVTWDHWLDHIRARDKPDLAFEIEKLDAMLAPAKWPRPGLPLPTPHEEPESDRREREERQHQAETPKALNNQTFPSCKTAERIVKATEVDTRAEE